MRRRISGFISLMAMAEPKKGKFSGWITTFYFSSEGVYPHASLSSASASNVPPAPDARTSAHDAENTTASGVKPQELLLNVTRYSVLLLS
jgi:hypothetical protein